MHAANLSTNFSHFYSVKQRPKQEIRTSTYRIRHARFRKFLGSNILLSVPAQRKILAAGIQLCPSVRQQCHSCKGCSAGLKFSTAVPLRPRQPGSKSSLLNTYSAPNIRHLIFGLPSRHIFGTYYSAPTVNSDTGFLQVRHFASPKTCSVSCIW